MTQEEIAKQANEYSLKRIRKNERYKALFTISEIAQDFKAGASWRINSVWHTMYEMPKQGLTLCVNDNGCALICGPNYYEFKNAAMELGFTRWAYVSDLLPEGKEDGE